MYFTFLSKPKGLIGVFTVRRGRNKRCRPIDSGAQIRSDLKLGTETDTDERVVVLECAVTDAISISYCATDVDEGA